MCVAAECSQWARCRQAVSGWNWPGADCRDAEVQGRQADISFGRALGPALYEHAGRVAVGRDDAHVYPHERLSRDPLADPDLP